MCLIFTRAGFCHTVHYKQGHFTLHDLKSCTNVTAEHSAVSVG